MDMKGISGERSKRNNKHVVRNEREGDFCYIEVENLALLLLCGQCNL